MHEDSVPSVLTPGADPGANLCTSVQTCYWLAPTPGRWRHLTENPGSVPALSKRKVILSCGSSEWEVYVPTCEEGMFVRV